MNVRQMYQMIIRSLTHSILLTYVFVVAKIVKSEFVFMAQVFILFFLLGMVYRVLFQRKVREKVFRFFHVKR